MIWCPYAPHEYPTADSTHLGGDPLVQRAPVGSISSGTQIRVSLLGNVNPAGATPTTWRLKPSSSKGRYLKKVTISTTMGPGVQVDPNRTRNVAGDDEA